MSSLETVLHILPYVASDNPHDRGAFSCFYELKRLDPLIPPACLVAQFQAHCVIKH